MRKICRLHVLIRIQPDQYQARPIRGQDLGGVPAPVIIGVTRPRFFAEARRVFCLCCTSPFVGYSPCFPLSPTIILRIFSRWVIGAHYDVSETWPSRLHRRPQLRTTLARRRRRGTQDPQPPGRRSAQRPRLVPGTGPLSQSGLFRPVRIHCQHVIKGHHISWTVISGCGDHRVRIQWSVLPGVRHRCLGDWPIFVRIHVARSARRAPGDHGFSVKPGWLQTSVACPVQIPGFRIQPENGSKGSTDPWRQVRGAAWFLEGPTGRTIASQRLGGGWRPSGSRAQHDRLPQIPAKHPPPAPECGGRVGQAFLLLKGESFSICIRYLTNGFGPLSTTHLGTRFAMPIVIKLAIQCRHTLGRLPVDVRFNTSCVMPINHRHLCKLLILIPGSTGPVCVGCYY